MTTRRTARRTSLPPRRALRAPVRPSAIRTATNVTGTRPSPGTAAYGAAKAGLHHLVTSLAIEWAPKVRVNTVVPGFVTTDAALPHYGDAGAAAAIAVGVPLGRMATPEDVAGACQFLASPQASYISGSSLTLHGGGELPAFLSAPAPERTD